VNAVRGKSEEKRREKARKQRIESVHIGGNCGQALGRQMREIMKAEWGDDLRRRGRDQGRPSDNT